MPKTRAIDWTKIAGLLRAIADELEASSDGAHPINDVERARAKRALKKLGVEVPKEEKKPRERKFPPPSRPASEVDRARAEKMLRRRGML